MHIDGNHKLIRWGFVIHGSIDGFSRKIMYLRSYANKASSVLNVFQNSIHKFGFPSRVRADQGMENVEVARFMLTQPSRGPDRKVSLLENHATTTGQSAYGVMCFAIACLNSTVFLVS